MEGSVPSPIDGVGARHRTQAQPIGRPWTLASLCCGRAGCTAPRRLRRGSRAEMKDAAQGCPELLDLATPRPYKASKFCFA